MTDRLTSLLNSTEKSQTHYINNKTVRPRATLVLLWWQEFATRSVLVFFYMPPRCWWWWRTSVGVKYKVVNGKQVDVAAAALRSGCPGMLLIAHFRVGSALSETVATVSLSALQCLDCPCCAGSPLSRLPVEKRTRRGGQAVSLTGLTRPAFTRDDAAFRGLSVLCGSEGQFSGNSAQKDHREHCKIPRWRCWFGGSQPLRWQLKFGRRNNTRQHRLLVCGLPMWILCRVWILWIYLAKLVSEWIL